MKEGDAEMLTEERFAEILRMLGEENRSQCRNLRRDWQLQNRRSEET